MTLKLKSPLFSPTFREVLLPSQTHYTHVCAEVTVVSTVTLMLQDVFSSLLTLLQYWNLLFSPASVPVKFSPF